MNIQKVLLGTLLVQPELAPYVLPVLEISDFEPDIQPIFAAAQGSGQLLESWKQFSSAHGSSPESGNHGVC